MAEQSPDNPFSNPTSTSDVVLVVEDKQLHVSKAILAVMSPVFERMFYGKFKEQSSSKVPLPGKKHHEMVEFLLHIYPTTLKKRQLTNKTVEAVMMLADVYQVQSIFDDCVTYLTTGDNRFSVSEMVHFLRLSEDKVQLKKVYGYFLNGVAWNYKFKDRTEDEEFDEISSETRYMVLRKRVHHFETNRSFHDHNRPQTFHCGKVPKML